MSFPTYAHYKDSGVEWLGEVPAHWSVTPFKWQIAKNDGGVWGDDPDGTDDTFVLRSTEQTVDGRWKLDDPALRKLSKGEKEACLLAVGDLVVTKSSGSSLHIGKTTIVTPDIAEIGCCYSNFMQRIRVASSFDARLAWYIMNNEVARLQFDLASNSTTGLANLNGTMIGQILVTVPPPSEQAGITNFLDRETTKLDILITEQRTLIDLLKEKRQAVISHAVTKGLDPRVPMKDSGVEWLGEVPAHWQILPLGFIAVDKCDGPFGSGIKSEHYTDEGALVVRLQNIRAGSFNMGEPVYLAKEYFLSQLKGHEVLAGDVLVAGLGDDNNLLGRACVAPEGLGMALVKADCFRFRIDPERCIPEYVALQLSAGAAFDAGTLATGTTRSRIPLGTMAARKFAFPGLTEQKVIVTFINQETNRLDVLTAEAQTTIALLQERRSALISAAVTGKIDVRQHTTEAA